MPLDIITSRLFNFLTKCELGPQVRYSCTSIWVKGHSGVKGNEEADTMARKAAWIGRRMTQTSITTPAGIRQSFPMHPKLGRGRKEWSKQAIKGLTYLTTDKGYQRAWLKKSFFTVHSFARYKVDTI